MITAEERALHLLSLPINKVPKLAYKYLQYLCSIYGGCGDIFITAYSHYTQIKENLIAKDKLYAIDDKAKIWFNNN